MAKTDSTRHPAGSSLSAQSPEVSQQSAPAKDPFDALSRRLLVAVSHIKLASQHFGDLSSLSREDVPAGMTLFEAAQDLEQLYNDIDAWYVQYEHIPKAAETAELSGNASQESNDGRTEGQRLYDDVAELERQLKSFMEEIAYESLEDLPEAHPTAQAFLNAEV